MDHRPGVDMPAFSAGRAVQWATVKRLFMTKCTVYKLDELPTGLMINRLETGAQVLKRSSPDAEGCCVFDLYTAYSSFERALRRSTSQNTI